MNRLLARLWRLGKPLQWRFLWLIHGKFICGAGIAAVGFPTGYANKGERHDDTIIREVREETGLTIKPGRLLKVRSGFRYRIEVYYEATLAGGLDGLALDSREILEARLFEPGELPEGMPDTHRELASG